MPRKKQPAAVDWKPTAETPAPKPRPAQRQYGGRKPSPEGPGIQVQTRLTRELLARLNSECERMGIDRSTLIRAAITRHLDTLDPIVPMKTR